MKKNTMSVDTLQKIIIGLVVLLVAKGVLKKEDIKEFKELLKNEEN